MVSSATTLNSVHPKTRPASDMLENAKKTLSFRLNGLSEAVNDLEELEGVMADMLDQQAEVEVNLMLCVKELITQKIKRPSSEISWPPYSNTLLRSSIFTTHILLMRPLIMPSSLSWNEDDGIGEQ